jgi:hypothetical protein
MVPPEGRVFRRPGRRQALNREGRRALAWMTTTDVFCSKGRANLFLFALSKSILSTRHHYRGGFSGKLRRPRLLVKWEDLC